MKELVAPVVKSANPPHPEDRVAVQRMHLLLQQLRRSRRRVQQLQQLGHEDTIRFTLKVQQQQGEQQQDGLAFDVPLEPLKVSHTLGEVRRLLGAGGGLALVPGIRLGKSRKFLGVYLSIYFSSFL